MFLMIQNKGVAPIESFTLLGASTTRNCGIDGAIGQFGTGNKQSVNLLLRNNIGFRIYCGKTRLSFSTEPYDMEGSTFDKVFCKLSGANNKKIDLGWVLDFGSIDWTTIDMALREFISNAIDRTIKETEEFLPSIESGDLCVKLTENAQAKDGYTRIFIKVEDAPEILEYVKELPKRFLHFSKDTTQLKETILPKANRSFTESNGPMIYREGVFVRQLTDHSDSVYDYNFRANEITIDDCRNSSEYALKAACAKAIKKADQLTLTDIFRALASGKNCFEAKIDTYYTTFYSATKEERNNWIGAWEIALGDKTVSAPVNGDNYAKTYAKRKGYNVAEIPDSWFTTVEHFGIQTTDDVLTENERKGREIFEATSSAKRAVEIVWEWCKMSGFTNDKEMPQVFCYKELTDAESDLMGFAKDNGVYLREDISSGLNKLTLKAALEEVAHYITGATDNSRDFQSFFRDMLVEFLFNQ